MRDGMPFAFPHRRQAHAWQARHAIGIETPSRILSRMRRFDDEDLTGAQFRECDLSRARLIGVVMQDAEIDGLITNLTVNGVEVMPYVEAELDRRHPVRLLIRSDEPVDLRQAWRQLWPLASQPLSA